MWQEREREGGRRRRRRRSLNLHLRSWLLAGAAPNDSRTMLLARSLSQNHISCFFSGLVCRNIWEWMQEINSAFFSQSCFSAGIMSPFLENTKWDAEGCSLHSYKRNPLIEQPTTSTQWPHESQYSGVLCGILQVFLSPSGVVVLFVLAPQFLAAYWPDCLLSLSLLTFLSILWICHYFKCITVDYGSWSHTYLIIYKTCMYAMYVIF